MLISSSAFEARLYQRAHQIVTVEEVTEDRSALLGEIVGLMDPRYQVEHINRALAWCRTIENKLAFIKMLPSPLRRSYQKSIGDAVLLMEDPSEKVLRIAALVRIFRPEDERELTRYFEAIFDEMINDTSTPREEATDSVGSATGRYEEIKEWPSEQEVDAERRTSSALKRSTQFRRGAPARCGRELVARTVL